MAMRCARRSSRQNGVNGATNGDQNVRIGREAVVMTWQLVAAVTRRAARCAGQRPPAMAMPATAFAPAEVLAGCGSIYTVLRINRASIRLALLRLALLRRHDKAKLRTWQPTWLDSAAARQQQPTHQRLSTSAQRSFSRTRPWRRRQFSED